MSEGAPLEESDIHDVLRNDRRRELIDYLRRHEGRTTIQDLSEHIAALETDEDPPPRNVRQSVYVSLHQTHLPKLEALGIVEYDSESKEIRERERAEEVEGYMHPDGDGDEWTKLYVGLGVLGAVLSAGVSLTGGDGGIVAVPIFLLLAVLAGYQIWKRDQT